MGCCVSRPSGPNSPYPGGAPNGSSRAINAAPPAPPPLALPESAQGDEQQQALNSPTSRRNRRDRRPLDQHIDKPLRRHEWTAQGRQWTKADLARERAEFFDTRVTGRPQVWQTIHAALQVLWDPASQNAQDDGSNGLATAQMILSAAEISLPTGDLANGVYDSWGNYYQIPEHIVSNPTNVREGTSNTNKGDVSTAGEETTSAGDEGASEEDDGEEVGGKKEEKGKETAEERMTLRARLSETGKDVRVSFPESETVKNIAKEIAEKAGLPPSKTIRLVYMGKIFKNDTALVVQGWQSGHIVNAFVFDASDN